MHFTLPFVLFCSLEIFSDCTQYVTSLVVDGKNGKEMIKRENVMFLPFTQLLLLVSWRIVGDELNMRKPHRRALFFSFSFFLHASRLLSVFQFSRDCAQATTV